MSSTSRGHRFFVSRHWTNAKLAFKPAIAVTITLALGQNTKIAGIESSTGYLSSIFAILLMPNKGRLVHIEQILVASTLVALVIPFCMLSYLSCKATRSVERDAASARTYIGLQEQGVVPSLATFYQPEAAAVSAVFLFLLSWGANVAKTMFVPFTTPIVTGTIIGGVLLLEGYLAPSWMTWYALTKQLLYNAYIGFAVAAVVNLVVFPYNSREPYLRMMGDFLDATERMISQQSKHFSTAHLRIRATRAALRKQESDEEKTSSEADISDKDIPDIVSLQTLRQEITMLAGGLEMARVAAKREITFGHLDARHIQEMHKLSRSLLIPLFGCNLWSQISQEIQKERLDLEANPESTHPGFFTALGLNTTVKEDEEAELFTLMEAEIGPRFDTISQLCKQAIEHIKRAILVGEYKRAPFYIRPFVNSPRPYDTEDTMFSAQFEQALSEFWQERYIVKHELQKIMDGPSTPSLLIMYMEATLHGIGERLLAFCRWSDDLQSTNMMHSRRLTLPESKRYTRAFAKTFSRLSKTFDPHHHSSEQLSSLPGDNEAYQSESYDTDAATVLLRPAQSDLLQTSSIASSLFLPVYRLSHFLFESQLSSFGFRAAIAMVASALPAYFPNSVHVFLEYRLLWISFTILIGLQPVLGRGVAAIIFRIAGTIVGGVLGLLAVEIGRVPAGIIPVFFITAIPQFYLLQVDPKKYMLTILLSTITEVLVVGYETSLYKLGRSVIERSGQAVLAAPALMGYRICLTLAGVVFIIVFSLFPALPTARRLLQSSVAKHFGNTADSFMLKSLRYTNSIYELPQGLDKAIAQKQTESIVLSTASHEFAAFTIFEPSPRGKFPLSTWNSLLVLLDNYNTALAVSNNLITKLSACEPGESIPIQHVLDFYADAALFRTYTSCLLAIGDAISSWRPLPPVLLHPMQAHLEAKRDISHLIEALAASRSAFTIDTLDKDTITYICALQITEAIMARYLSQCVKLCSSLVGESGYTSYLSGHRKMT